MTTAVRSPLRELLAGIPVDVDTDPDTGAEAAFGLQHALSAGADSRVYRYALTRIWDESLPVLPWVMLNPSTANAFKIDPTIGRVLTFTRAWGYGAAWAFNLHGLRSTDPKALREHPAPIGPHNDAVIVRALAALIAPSVVVCAWGANATHGQGERMVRLIRDAGHRPMCLGRTSAGAPRHPLYVAGATKLREVPA